MKTAVSNAMVRVAVSAISTFRAAKRNRGTIQGIVALVLISVGVGIIYPPAALIVAGLLIMADKVI